MIFQNYFVLKNSKLQEAAISIITLGRKSRNYSDGKFLLMFKSKRFSAYDLLLPLYPKKIDVSIDVYINRYGE